MAVLFTIADKKQSCGGQTANTGRLGCQIEFGTPLHAIGMRKGFRIPKQTDLTIEYINTKVQEGVFIPLIGASSFEDLSAEDTFSTNSAGVERLNLRGLPKYRLVFEEGHEFYRELSKITNFKGLDFIVGDELGNWRMADHGENGYGGFSVGQTLAQLTTNKVQGGDPESKGITMQFIDRIQWDREYVIFNKSQLGFAPDDITGVNSVNLAFVVIPITGATTLKVSAVLAADNATPVTGLKITDFKVTVKDLVVKPSGVVEDVATGIYTITISALTLADVVTVETHDTSNFSSVVISGDALFRSEVLKETTIAP